MSPVGHDEESQAEIISFPRTRCDDEPAATLRGKSTLGGRGCDTRSSYLGHCNHGQLYIYICTSFRSPVECMQLILLPFDPGKARERKGPGPGGA